MTSKILQELKNIEMRHDVKVLYACESGSRAWDFPSTDSDYDVRFLYAHPLDWYLSIFKTRDVIELPINDLLDINGWDLKKALNHLYQSNPVLFEWLNSPIVYTAQEHILYQMKELAGKTFLPRSACHHYLGIAKNASKSVVADNERIRLKAYFYVLRPLFCCQWIIDRLEPPPMRFQELLQAFLPPGALRDTVDELLRDKQEGTESDMIEPIPELDSYLVRQFHEIEAHIPDNPEKIDSAILDETFRDILRGRCA